jgi:hypothetical protein
MLGHLFPKMHMPKFRRRPVLRLGLAMWAAALGLGLAIGTLGDILGFTTAVLLPFVIMAGSLGLLGFVMLVLSTFLPKSKYEKPAFTEELLGREKLQYGVYTDGNWMSVLQDKSKEKKQRRHK